MAHIGLETITMYRAILRKDKRYDGIFYFTKKDTKIYCRPSCLTSHQAEEEYLFFSDIQTAKSYGLKACNTVIPPD